MLLLLWEVCPKFSQIQVGTFFGQVQCGPILNVICGRFLVCFIFVGNFVLFFYAVLFNIRVKCELAGGWLGVASSLQ